MINKQKGNILLYSLLIVSALLTTTLVVSNLVVARLKQTKLVLDSQEAYYSAESGAEKVLYFARKENQDLADGDCNIDKVNCNIILDKTAITEIKKSLLENKVIQFEIFDINNLAVGGGIRAVEFDWQTLDNAWLKVSVASWQPVAGVAWPTEYDFSKKLYSPGSFGDGYFADTNFEPQKNYIVRIKAIYGNIESISVKLYKDSALQDLAPIPNYYKIIASGEKNSATSQLEVVFKKSHNLYELFDYVLFSQELITK